MQRCTAFALAYALTACAGTQTHEALPQAATAARLASSGSGDLIYVADDGTNYSGAYVLVYTFPQGKHVMTLTGFHLLDRECSDEQGDVFVVAPGEEISNPTTVYEYAHGGYDPINTETEPGVGLGCSVDPTTHNLAVANVQDQENPYHKDWGDVAIFSPTRAAPVMYYSSKLQSFSDCAYDTSGNLYLLTTINGAYALARLRARTSSSIQQLTLNKKLYGGTFFIPTVQWDGQEMTVSSTRKQLEPREESTGPVDIYRLNVSGSDATVTGTTTLVAPQNAFRGQTWIVGKTIAGVTYYHGWAETSLWTYPKGGSPYRQIRHKQDPPGSVLEGITISAGVSGSVARRTAADTSLYHL